MKNYVLTILSEDYSKEICSWRYEGEYSIYNFSDWDTVVENQWDLSIEEKRESEFMAIISNNELVAYGSISLKGDIAYIGIGLKPSFVERVMGRCDELIN